MTRSDYIFIFFLVVGFSHLARTFRQMKELRKTQPDATWLDLGATVADAPSEHGFVEDNQKLIRRIFTIGGTLILLLWIGGCLVSLWVLGGKLAEKYGGAESHETAPAGTE